MAASPLADSDHPPAKHPSSWNPMDVDSARDHMGPGGDLDLNGAPPPADDRAVSAPEGADYAPGAATGNDTDSPDATARPDSSQRGEKIIKHTQGLVTWQPSFANGLAASATLNKVYIGGLPEHTRKEDLESCFGKIGSVVNIELKVGYGFVEFDSREAAEESVAKYHEGYFMGNKIRVEISHGGGRTAKYSGDPGACFKCGQMGHWARECPNHLASGRRPSHPGSEPALIDRIAAPRDYPPPLREYPYRSEYARYPPPGDPRFYDYPPPPPRREGYYGRPPSPPRDFRDFPPPPSIRSARDYDDFRMRGVPPPPPARLDSRGYYPEGEAAPPGYPPRGYPAPPPREYYDRYDRRTGPPPPERYGTYPAPAVRPRTPPGAPPARTTREDYDRPPARDYPPAETRGRAASPARYAEYPPPRPGSVERYRRRSQSPPSRGASGAPYESAGYSAGSGGATYNGSSGGYANGTTYSSGAPARTSGGNRDYAPPRSREVEPAGSYRRS
ncbi:hypothetical protein LXA43DRAFT_877493 [Ganoderma leucocontextum]|nr:hypothetical protein LXA43DRAFT_877493 [Ganoderma leucocontextum]